MYKIQVYQESDIKILIADFIVVMLVVGFSVHKATQIHPAICFLIALVSAVIFTWIFISSKIGFWIVSVVFSAFWALLAGSISLAITKGDNIWFGVISGVAFIICMILHSLARD